MVNINKLKGKIVEQGVTIEHLATAIGQNKSTLYRKLNSNGEGFTIKEVNLISQELNLTLDEVNNIFFGNNVA